MLPGPEPHVPASMEDSMLVFGLDNPDVPNHFEPTAFPPGTEGKIAVLRRRVELGLPLWHPGDPTTYNGWTLPLPRRMLDS